MMKLEAFVDEVLGIQGAKLTGDNVMFRCPLPNHDDRRPSFGISTTPPFFYHCFGCHQKGTLIGLVMKLKKTDPDTAKKLVATYDPDGESTLQHITQKLNTPDFSAKRLVAQAKELYKTFEPDERAYGYMEGRGFSRDYCERYGVRYDRERDRAVLPLRMFGEIHGLVGRGIGPNVHPKYYYYDHMPASKILVGAKYTREAIVVEGTLDYMRLDEIGYSAVATLGSSLSTHQLQVLLRMGCKTVTMMYDNDSAGLTGTYEAVTKLKDKIFTKTISWPKHCSDPGSSSPADILRMISGATVWFSS